MLNFPYSTSDMCLSNVNYLYNSYFVWFLKFNIDYVCNTNN